MIIRQKLTATLLSLILGVIVQAQNLELGKVSKAELEEKAHPLDSLADAAVLFARGHTRFEYTASKGFFTITEVRMRVKIYKKSGYDWANERVLYYTGTDENQNVVFSKAVTYNLINGEIVKTKAKNENEFTERANRDWSFRKLAMPDVREGSVIEYMITLTSPYISNLYDWDFQKTIPVNMSEYKVSIPEYFKFSIHTKGFINPQTTYATVRRDFTGVSNDLVNKKGGFRNERSEYAFDCMENTSTYTLTDVAAMKDEEYVNNIKNYTASISHELSAIRYPNQPEKNLAKDWEAVARKIYAHPDFGFELDKRSYFEADLASLKGSDAIETTSRVYAFVKNRMAWNGADGYLCQSGVKKAYQNQSGNVADINLMLIAMLREAGITANPVLLSTRSNGIALFPSFTGFNYVVAAVEFNDERILLDATDKKLIPGILPVRALNWYGRLIGESGNSISVPLMSGAVSKESHTITAAIKSDGSISGKMRTQHADYNAYLTREEYFDRPNGKYEEYLENLYDGVAIADFQIANESDLGKPVIESFSFSEFGGAEIIGDRIYFSPLLFLSEDVNPFKQDKRDYPVDFTFAHQQKINAVFTIPAGYGVESMPLPASVSIEDNICEFRYNIAQSGNQLQLNYSFNINRSVVSAGFYESLKTFFRTLIEKENEKIVLKKI